MSKRKFFIKRVVSEKRYNVNGELLFKDYLYVICCKRFWIFFQYLLFYKIKNALRESRIDSFLSEEVEIRYSTNSWLNRCMASYFNSEEDAKKVLQDMMQHPNKYVNIR